MACARHRLRERDERGSMSEARKYTIEAQIVCIRRELAMRKRVYPKWAMTGRMKPEAADHEINCMQAVHDTLVSLQISKSTP
jgi:hypothetical protein